MIARRLRTATQPVIDVGLLFLLVGLVSALAVFLGVMLATILILTSAPARSQEHHDLHHAQYQNWQSNAGFNCCNNQDCGELPDKDVRVNGDHYEVKVDDEWCPLLFEHLVRAGTGTSPDWSRHHACILSPASGLTPCERFKCFKGKVEL